MTACIPKKAPRWLILGGITMLMVSAVQAGMQDVLEAIEASEFNFARATSEVPFLPLGWATNNYYPQARFEPEYLLLPDATVEENATSIGALMPVYVSTRDMILLGADLSLDLIRVKAGPFADQSVVRITPVAAWLHQLGQDDLVGSFVAPLFSKEIEQGGSWGASGYAGVVGMHWVSDRVQWLYGGVYQNSFGQDTFYPYLGLQWTPSPKLALSLIFPWPSITYVPAENWMLQVGISPGGSSWVKRRGAYEVTESFGSWNLTGSVGYRLHGSFWLVGSAGAAGFRAWELGNDDNGLRYE
ncbi:MAG TPA: hypothetical protein VK995_07035, partial [Oceanipulchritudo sp.]|nr:hypothetical protein [Oceanipulchritudo sp.]